MHLINRTTDSADKPNAPIQGAGWGSVYPSSRRRDDGAPLWLWLGACIALSVPALVLLAFLWQFLAPLVPAWQAGLASYGTAIGAVLLVALALVVGGLALGLARAGWAVGARASAWAQQARVVRLESDHPVLVEQLPQLQLAADAQRSHYEAAIAFAKTPGHAMTTYGPSETKSVRIDLRNEGLPELPAPEDTPVVLPARSFRELVASGEIGGTGRTLLVGHSLEDGSPLSIDMDGTGFIGLGGKSGQGKSNTGLLLLSQAAYFGWAVFACDLHYHKRESMLRRAEPISGLLARQATTAAEIADAIRTVDRIGRNRLDGKVPADTTVLLIIDEFTHLVISGQLPRDVLDLLPAMAIAYRGVRVHGLLIGHDYGAKSLGQNYGRVLRGALTTAIAHRMTPDAAEFLLPAGYAKAAEGLSTGRALVFNDATETPVRAGIPFVRAEDLTWAAQGTPPRPYAARIAATPAAMPTAPSPASTGASAPVPPAPAPTERIAGLSEPTIGERILAFLSRRPATWQMSPEIAVGTGLDTEAVQKELSRLHAARQIDRDGRRGVYRYRPLAPPAHPHTRTLARTPKRP